MPPYRACARPWAPVGTAPVRVTAVTGACCRGANPNARGFSLVHFSLNQPFGSLKVPNLPKEKSSCQAKSGRAWARARSLSRTLTASAYYGRWARRRSRCAAAGAAEAAVGSLREALGVGARGVAQDPGTGAGAGAVVDGSPRSAPRKRTRLRASTSSSEPCATVAPSSGAHPRHRPCRRSPPRAPRRAKPEPTLPTAPLPAPPGREPAPAPPAPATPRAPSLSPTSPPSTSSTGPHSTTAAAAAAAAPSRLPTARRGEHAQDTQHHTE